MLIGPPQHAQWLRVEGDRFEGAQRQLRQCVADTNATRPVDERADSEMGVALAVDRSKYLEVAFEARLWPGDHDASVDLLRDGQGARPECNTRAHECILVPDVEHHVGPESPHVPVAK